MDRTVEVCDLRLQVPCSLAIFGKSQSGKTTHVKKLIEMRDLVFTHPIDKIYFFFKSWQPAYDELESEVEFVEGSITMAWLRSNVPRAQTNEQRQGPATMIVIDDGSEDLSSDTVEVVTIGVHHHRLVLIPLYHAVFTASSPHLRTISQNLNYFQVHKSPRDMLQISRLASQIDPGNARRFVSIYKEATRNPFSYLFLDMTQQCEEKFRLRSNCLFENNDPIIVYERL